MKMKVFKLFSVWFTAFVLIVSGCEIIGGNGEEETTGAIEGRAFFYNEYSHSNIQITLESTNGFASQSVTRSATTGVYTRAVYTTTTTDSSGYYLLEELPEGLYTVHASSVNSSEKAVSTSIQVEPGRTVYASDLNLTPVGHAEGQIILDGSALNNEGFIVFVAGTSYMAVTDTTGRFKISDIPVGNNYSIIIMKGNYQAVWTNINVSAGLTTNLSIKNISSDDLNTGGSLWLTGVVDPLDSEGDDGQLFLNTDTGDVFEKANGVWTLLMNLQGSQGAAFVWKGTLTTNPLNPELNWAYYNSADGKAYIYNGTAWEILVQDGIAGPGIVWKGTLTADPVSPEVNWAYYNSVDGRSYIYDGSTWQILARDGSDGTGTGGGGIIWKGSLSTPPELPDANWAYYNNVDGISYIFDGTNWQILAQDGSDGADGTTGGGIIWKGSLTSHPATPELNWAYYNSVDGRSYIYDGSSWQILAQDGSDGTGTGGGGIIWKGSLTTAPELPDVNWAYYNSVDGISYIYDGATWQILAQDGSDGLDGTGTGTGGIVWKGSLASAPDPAEEFWAYYNTTDGNSYIFIAGAWDILAQGGAASGTDSGWPFVASVLFPEDNSTGVSRSPTISLLFNETLDTSVLGTVTFGDPLTTFTNGVNSVFTFSTTNVTNDTLLIDPSSRLKNNTNYRDISTYGFADINGNPMSTFYGGGYDFTTISSYYVSSLAGSLYSSYASDGVGSSARFALPYGMVVVGDYLYVCDTYDHSIRRIELSTGTVTTFAGSGYAGTYDGYGTYADFYYPWDITSDGSNLYVTTWNHVIRKIDLATQYVSTIAGLAGVSGYLNDYTYYATFNYPAGLLYKDGALYVCDSGNHVIRKVDLGSSYVSTYAGYGYSGFYDGSLLTAEFNTPYDIVEYNGDFYVSDSENHSIRKLTSTNVTTYAGTSGGTGGHNDGAASTSLFYRPYGMVVVGDSIYIAEWGNHIVRQINLTTGIVSTVAGTPNVSGSSDGYGDSAQFYYPYGIAVDSENNLYISDAYNTLIRKLD